MSEPVPIVSLPTPELETALNALSCQANFVQWDLQSPSPYSTIDIVVPPYMSSPKLLSALKGVKTKLVQSQSVGFDGVADHLPKGHVFANAASVHETSTAELALGLIIASQRGIKDFILAADKGVWAPARYESLADRTVLLVGYGGVAQAVEERLKGFEVNILRVAKNARTTENGEVHSLDKLHSLLAQADIVVVAVPLNNETAGLINEEFLSSMRDGALLVNISRGPVALTAALVKEATNGRLRLALDVTDPEPLPNGHILFSLPNVIISPHVGGNSTAMTPRMARLIALQVEKIQRGEGPVNVVLQS